MGFGHFFVDRPIFASVISIVLMIVGGVALLALPIAQYPDIAPPTIVVAATYPGANAETIAETVAAPIEQEINGVEGMIYMTSQATGDGALSITVTFAPGTDLDNAQVQVQNRVAQAEPRLPEEVTPQRGGRQQAVERLPDARQPDLARRLARRDLPVELRLGQSGRCAEADQRSGRHPDLRRTRAVAPGLARSQPSRGVQPGRRRRDRGAAGPECPGLGRCARPASGARGHHQTDYRHHPGPLPDRGAVPGRHRPGDAGWKAPAGAATSPASNWGHSSTARTPISTVTKRLASGFSSGRAPTPCPPPRPCRRKWSG